MSVTTSRSLLSEGNAAAIAALKDALGSDKISTRELDRMALAVDASHYLHTPDAIMRAHSPHDVGVAMRVASELGWPLTFRGGGTSLSGQALSEGLTVDVQLRGSRPRHAGTGTTWAHNFPGQRGFGAIRPETGTRSGVVNCVHHRWHDC